MSEKEQFEILLLAVQKMSLARDIETIMDIVKSTARRIANSDGVTFVLRENDLCYYVDEDAISQLWKGQKFPMKICISGWVMNHKQTAIIEDIYIDDRIPADAYRPTFVKSLAMVPIRKENPLGSIGIYWAKKYKASQEEINLIQSLADSTAIAIENIYAYKSLKDANKKLETKIYESNLKTAELTKVNSVLETTMEKLEVSNVTKNKLFAIIAHDLKSPFNTLMGFSDLLLKNIHNYDIAKIEKQIQHIDTIAKSTYNLLLDLLMWSKSQSGHLAFEPKIVKLKEICDQVIDGLIDSSDKKGIRISFFEAQNTLLKADTNMLRTILRNLISNAIKFTHLNGKINIHAETDNEFATITISDNGVGISKENIEKIWNPEQEHSTIGTANEEGSGLGLTLCKEFVEKHGGNIWAESNLGKGSDFKFTMPLYFDLKTNQDQRASFTYEPHV